MVPLLHLILLWVGVRLLSFICSISPVVCSVAQDSALVRDPQALEILTFVVVGKLIKVNLQTLLGFCIPTVLLTGPTLTAD